MTVHKAKGLEFPVVILADMTAKLCASMASRTIDSPRRVCAVRLAGCTPADLLATEVLERDQLRLAEAGPSRDHVVHAAACGDQVAQREERRRLGVHANAGLSG